MATMRDDDLERATAQAMEDEERDTATEQAMEDESLASATGRALDDEEQPLPSEIWARNAQNRIFAANDAPLTGDAGGLGVVFGASGRTRPAPRTSMPLGGVGDPEIEDRDARARQLRSASENGRGNVMREALEAIRSTRTTPTATPDASGVTAAQGGGGLSQKPIPYAGAQTMRPTYRLPGAEATHDAELRAGDRFAGFGASTGGVGVKMGKGGITEGAGGRTPLGGLSPEPDGKEDGLAADDPEWRKFNDSRTDSLIARARAKSENQPGSSDTLPDPAQQRTILSRHLSDITARNLPPAKPSTLQSFFGDKEDNNPSWIARRGAEWNTIGSDRKPDYGIADEMDARRAKVTADRKAAMAAERQRGLDASLMRLRELQGKSAEATARAAGQPKPAAVDPLLEDRRALLQKQGALADARAAAAGRAPVGRSASAGGHTGGGAAGGDAGMDDDALTLAADYTLRTGKQYNLGRDPTGAKHVAVLKRVAELAKERGVDPVAALTAYGADANTLKNVTKLETTLKGQEGSVDRHFDILLDAAKNVDNTPSPLINKPLNWVRSEVLGDANTSKLINAIETSASEYARYMTPAGVTTDAVRNKAEKMINAAMSDGTLEQVINQMRQEIKQKQAAIAASKSTVTNRIATGGTGAQTSTAATPQQDGASGKVRMRSPNGKTASVDSDGVEDAIAHGWTRI